MLPGCIGEAATGQLGPEESKKKAFTLKSGGRQFLAVLRLIFFFKQCMVKEGSEGPEVVAES